MTAPVCRHLAQKALAARANMFGSPLRSRGLAICRSLLEKAAAVPAYVLPPQGRLLGGAAGPKVLGELSADSPGVYRLPAPVTVLEFAPSDEAGSNADDGSFVPEARFSVAFDEDAGIGLPCNFLFGCFEVWMRGDVWNIDPAIIVIDKIPGRHESGVRLMAFGAYDWDLAPIEREQHPLSGWVASETSEGRGMFFHAPMELICALACKNVKQESVDAPHKLNKAREKRGKPPLPGYHYLTLDPEEAGARGPSTGSHASPRLHIRRGHVRLVRGERPVWVRQHMVGAPGTGFVKKDYNASRLTHA